jgi:hypothetical protein
MRTNRLALVEGQSLIAQRRKPEVKRGGVTFMLPVTGERPMMPAMPRTSRGSCPRTTSSKSLAEYGACQDSACCPGSTRVGHEPFSDQDFMVKTRGHLPARPVARGPGSDGMQCILAGIAAMAERR